MKKDREVHGLMKLPAEVVISELRQELGKSNAMTTELQDELTEAKKLICDLISDNTNKALQIVKLHTDVERLTDNVKRQQKANTKLHRSLYKLKYGGDENYEKTKQPIDQQIGRQSVKADVKKQEAKERT